MYYMNNFHIPYLSRYKCPMYMCPMVDTEDYVPFRSCCNDLDFSENQCNIKIKQVDISEVID
ncbi:hypothetical protein [Clostridium rectalis]|uniref:hypothetical protein n=1 Tax=Clostridium rectalis TaxID=2040295 RepID=UPI000F63C870|nr:hypothetical protein [Clostridium rectalis]